MHLYKLSTKKTQAGGGMSGEGCKSGRRPGWRAWVKTWCAAAFCVGLWVAPLSAGDFRIIDQFAGGTNGDGGPALDANLRPLGVAIDDDGNVYFADALANKVRRIDAVTKVVTALAGTGEEGDTGDGGQATDATLRGPSDVDVDSDGNVYVADRGNHKIRRIDAATGIITTVAGSGTPGFSGDNGPAVEAQLNNPTSIAVEDDGTFFISDTTNNRIREVFPGGGIRTFAGNGVSGFSGDGGPATNARLGSPWGIALDGDGNLYITELLNQRIRVVNRVTERINTFAGNGQFAFCDNVPALSACFRNPTNVDYDPAEDAIFVGDSGNQRVRRVPRDGGEVTTVAGDGYAGFLGDGGLATQARFNGPGGIAAHPTLGLFVADELNFRIRRVTAGPGGIISTYAGNGNAPFGGDGSPAIGAKLNGPSAIAADPVGNIYFADTQNQRVRRIDVFGIIDTIAGNGESGFGGDGGQATQATLRSPQGVAADSLGNVYIADTSNNRVRRVAASGVITTVLGNGANASTGDGGPGTSASVVRPSGLAVYENPSGSERYLYVCEPSANKVRRLNLNTNVVTRFAGTVAGDYGFSGDGGPANAAKLAIPLGVATDANGTVYIADAGNHRIRRVANGIIATHAGNGSFSYSGDGGLAISASLGLPNDVAVGPNGNVFISDSLNYRIRIVTNDGKIQTAAGTGLQTGEVDGEGGNPLDDLGNGNPSTLASFTELSGIAVDPLGNAYITEAQPDTIRWVEDLASLYGAAPPQGGIFGQIRHAMTQAPIKGVAVHVLGPANQTVSTSASGTFAADQLALATWLVEPSLQGGFASGTISALDASYVLQELVNSRELTSAQKLACDVTGDGAVSALDATRIMQKLTNPSLKFAAAENCGSDWLFIPDGAPAQNQTEILPELGGTSTCQMGAIQFSPLAGQPDGQDFLGVVLGDCTGNWRASGSTAALSGLASLGSEPATVAIGPSRSSRKRLRMPISVQGGGGLSSLEVVMTYDPNVLKPAGARTRRAARGGMLSWRELEPGRIALALASGTRIPTPARALIVIDFEILADAGRKSIVSAQARVDEASARTRVTRPRSRR